MFAAGKTAAVSGAGPDDKFNYVTMLLHGDGTNGAQNNTFLDSSTNNFTITRNGNTTQGSFSPYGSNWSNFFDGTGDYLGCGSQSAYAFGTSNFTMECWAYATSFASYNSLTGSRTGFSDGASTNYSFGIDGTGSIYFYSAGFLVTSSAGAINLNSWNHIALVRSGTSTNQSVIYVNGVSVGTGTISNNLTGTALAIGGLVNGNEPFTGYISNVRLNNTALYSTTFTPPTAPLTAVSGTSLLTCQSNRFFDSSANGFTLTPNGNTSVQRFNPFGASTAYSTSVIGGSGYFDGSGDYLGCGSQSAYAFGTGDFTLNVWVYLTSAPTYMSIADTRTSGWALAIDASRAIYLYSDAVGFVVTSAVGAVPFNAWTYVTVKRVSGTMTLYLNAVSINSAANSTNFSNTTLTVGANGSGGEPFFGYICDFQAIKGTGTTPTLPTAPLTNVTNTSLLLNYTNGAIFDNAMMNDLETVGNAQISTSVKKYGTGSLAFDGTGDYLSIAGTPNLAFGTGNFTIELWAYRLSGTNNGLFQLSTTAGGFKSNDVNNLALAYASGGITYYANNNSYVPSTTVSNNQWDHLALVRSGTTTTLYFNGVSVSSITDSTNYTGTHLVVGGYYDTTYVWNGYIDDLRITKGYARYTTTFTPPTSALSDTGP